MENNSTWPVSPPSPTTWGKRTLKFNAFATVLATIGLIFMYVAPSVVFVIVGVETGTIDPRHPENIPARQQVIGQLFAYLPIAAYTLLVLPPLAGRSLGELGFRLPGLRELGIAAIGIAGMMLAVDGSGWAMEKLTHHHDTEAAIATLRQLKSTPDKILFASLAVLFAPFIEELTFRAFLFNAFWRYMPLGLAALLSAAGLGALHAIGQAPSQFLTIGLPLACGGIVLSWVYVTSRNFWSCFLTHGAFNGIVTALLLFTHLK